MSGSAPRLKVAIVGGGIGGLVPALALRERGIRFELYEQADELREIGAAVALSPTARASCGVSASATSSRRRRSSRRRW